jgi:hypothetical protein
MLINHQYFMHVADYVHNIIEPLSFLRHLKTEDLGRRPICLEAKVTPLNLYIVTYVIGYRKQILSDTTLKIFSINMNPN